jgi:hypothetical protein
VKSKTIATFYTEFPIMLRVWKVNHKRRLYGDFSPTKRTRLRQCLPDIHETIHGKEDNCAVGGNEIDENDENEGNEGNEDIYNDLDENDEHDNFDEQADEEDSTPSIYVFLVPTVESLLKKEFADYLSSPIGGKKSPSSILAAVQRTALFLAWSYDKENSDVPRNIDDDDILTCWESNLDSWFIKVLHRPTKLVQDFIIFLQTTRQLKLTSARQYLEAVFTYAKYFADVKHEALDYSLDKLDRAVKAIRNSVKREEKHVSGALSIEERIQRGHWPENGMADLQRVVTERIQLWAIPIFDKHGAQRSVCESNYTDFLQLLTSAIYVEAPQGRVGGITNLKIDAYDDFLSHGYALGTKFKTSPMYGFQPVPLTDISCKLMVMYKTIFRPVAEMNCVRYGHSKTNRLWLNWNGSVMDKGQLGRHLTAFFKSQLQLHITTTTIRAIVETAAEDALRKGVIDQTKRAAISNVNGHSGATTQRHYVMQSRIADVHNGRAGTYASFHISS